MKKYSVVSHISQKRSILNGPIAHFVSLEATGSRSTVGLMWVYAVNETKYSLHMTYSLLDESAWSFRRGKCDLWWFCVIVKAESSLSSVGRDGFRVWSKWSILCCLVRGTFQCFDWSKICGSFL